MGRLNYITTVPNMRTQRMSLIRMPFVWSFYSSGTGALSFPPPRPLYSARYNHSLGTSFYLSDIYIAGQPPQQRERPPHCTFSVCHPEVRSYFVA